MLQFFQNKTRYDQIPPFQKKPERVISEILPSMITLVSNILAEASAPPLRRTCPWDRTKTCRKSSLFLKPTTKPKYPPKISPKTMGAYTPPTTGILNNGMEITKPNNQPITRPIKPLNSSFAGVFKRA